MINVTADTVVRLAPPLTIEQGQLEAALKIVLDVLKAMPA
jgi:acetylornithine/succinyldiaminopimelate/putrescine aminotransferase